MPCFIKTSTTTTTTTTTSREKRGSATPLAPSTPKPSRRATKRILCCFWPSLAQRKSRPPSSSSSSSASEDKAFAPPLQKQQQNGVAAATAARTRNDDDELTTTAANVQKEEEEEVVAASLLPDIEKNVKQQRCSQTRALCPVQEAPLLKLRIGSDPCVVDQVTRIGGDANEDDDDEGRGRATVAQLDNAATACPAVVDTKNNNDESPPTIVAREQQTTNLVPAEKTTKASNGVFAPTTNVPPLDLRQINSDEGARNFDDKRTNNNFLPALNAHNGQDSRMLLSTRGTRTAAINNISVRPPLETVRDAIVYVPRKTYELIVIVYTWIAAVVLSVLMRRTTP